MYHKIQKCQYEIITEKVVAVKKTWQNILLIILSIIILFLLTVFAFWFSPAIWYASYAGIITVDELGINVDLLEVSGDKATNEYTVRLVNTVRQFVVDKENCAVQYDMQASGYIAENQADGSIIIGDHSGQNFAMLKECDEGMSVVIKRPDGNIENYVVARVFIGYNRNNDLEYEDGKSILKDNPNGIILYTCVDDTEIPVYIVFLQPGSSQ